MARAVRRAPSSLRSRANCRQTIWARETSLTVVPTPAGIAVDLLADFRLELGVTANPPGVTVGGVIMDFTVSNPRALAEPTAGVQVGLLVTSEGTQASVERPITNAHADWMWIQELNSGGTGANTVASTFDTGSGPYRVRSKRRMDEIGMNFWMVFENTGADLFTVRSNVSTLLIMP